MGRLRAWIARWFTSRGEVAAPAYAPEHAPGMPSPTWSRGNVAPAPARPRFQRPYTITSRPRMSRPVACRRTYL